VPGPDERNQLKTELKQKHSDLLKALIQQNRLKRQLQLINTSFSYRLGNTLNQAIRNPGRNTILLPYHLFKLGIVEQKKLKAIAANKFIPARLPEESVSSDLVSPPSSYTIIYDKEVQLEEKVLSPGVCLIKEKYTESYGIEKNLVGGYYEIDWKRIDYVSSLLPEYVSVLDAGAGIGAFFNLLVSLKKFRKVIGLDIRKKIKFFPLSEDRSSHFIYASVTDIPFKDKCFDFVTCMEVLEHLEKKWFIAALLELRRVSRSLIITVPYYEPEPLPHYHKLRFTDIDLLTYFPNGNFTLLKRPKNTSWMLIYERQNTYNI
jgi:hypothetical protein